MSKIKSNKELIYDSWDSTKGIIEFKVNYWTYEELNSRYSINITTLITNNVEDNNTDSMLLPTYIPSSTNRTIFLTKDDVSAASIEHNSDTTDFAHSINEIIIIALFNKVKKEGYFISTEEDWILED